MTRSIELVDTGILRIMWDGVVNRENYSNGIKERIRFADEHHLNRYVLIFDLRKAKITIFDIRLAAWSANADPRMTHSIIIGKSSLVTITVNTLLRLTKLQIEFANSDTQALERARQIVKGWD
jgi:hypothetical protein